MSQWFLVFKGKELSIDMKMRSEVQISKLSIYWWRREKQTVVYLQNGILLSSIKELMTGAVRKTGAEER